MKVLASALALLLVGLTGVWLWLDATAEAGQDRAGVVITGEADLATTRELAEAAGLDGPPVVPGNERAGVAPGADEGADPADEGADPADEGADPAVEDDGATAGSTDDPRSTEDPDRAGQVVDVLLAASTELRTRVRDAIEAIRAEEQAAERAAEQEAAEREAAEQAPAPRPVPVQPPPVVLDDDDDDWDDDDWDDWDDDDWDDDDDDDDDD